MALRAPPRAADATMVLTRLALFDFRSYAAAEIAPDAGLTVVAGPNGTGKTNMLEAIHATIIGRSHRAGADAELVRHGAPFARVRLELAGGTAIELVLPGADAPAGIRKRLMRERRGAPARPACPRSPASCCSARRRCCCWSGRPATGAASWMGSSPSETAARHETWWRSPASSPSATRCCAPSGPRRRRSTPSASGTSSWHRSDRASCERASRSWRDSSSASGHCTMPSRPTASAERRSG